MFTDRPIENSANDALDRTDFSYMIGDILINTPLRDSLCIGLMGPWGSGKTSIINMVEEYVKTEDRNPPISIMRFSPWNFTTTEQLTSQFFLQMAELFEVDQSEKSKIGAAISKYAHGLETSVISSLISLSSPVGTLVSNLIKTGMEKAGNAVEGMAFENKSIQKQKDEIQNLLKNVKEKIVIVIDDIDRLTDDQIRCVFQLVTVVCKFPNISYLLAFDRAVVEKALDNIQKDRGNEFLDKVIQVPISVPRISRDKLFSIMACHLEELIRLHDIKVIDKEKWGLLYAYCVSRLIRTQRDVLRLSNSLRSKLPLVSTDVEFEDLVILTILEQHEPQLYDWINRHEEVLTGQLSVETIHDHGDTDAEKRNRKARYSDEISNLLRHKEIFNVEYTIETLCMLFPAFSSKIGGYHNHYNVNTLRKNNNIGHPDKFDRFFSLKVLNEQITDTELQAIMHESSEEDIIKSISEKDSSNSSVELFDEIRVRIRDLSKERANTIIFSLQTIGDSLKAESSNGLFTRTASGEAMFLANELLRHLNIEDRFAVLENLVSRMEESNINFTSYILNRIYIAHNKIIDDEKKNPHDLYPSLNSEQELGKIEEEYLEKAKEIRSEFDPIKMMNKGWFISFYKHFSEGKKYLIQTITADPEKILYYLYSRTTQWHQTGRKVVEAIEITGGYRELVSDEQVQQAIRNYIDTGKLQKISVEEQRIIVAYIMKTENPTEYSGHIYVNDIDARLAEMLKSMQDNKEELEGNSMKFYKAPDGKIVINDPVGEEIIPNTVEAAFRETHPCD